jgi:hypothetical protein
VDEHALPVPAAVLDMLRWHKGACSIAGVGAIGTWKVKLEQAAQ